jgi:hypothetical protein
VKEKVSNRRGNLLIRKGGEGAPPEDLLSEQKDHEHSNQGARRDEGV